ncbi:hypothetical protein [Acinetobacter radioresistens]|uniref:hypothetical protein n=1 Tax=Acinetobacter radioresistens TaxID=40216 RepID=UPI00028E6CCA|nr:hypothetical protein [Acinetobacter radioresistens]BBL22315.1 hypothetical protein ACRAD_29860 [Acinetobacter radioresistens DSM 6976 = NBRC 102413 = CIP 103788]
MELVQKKFSIADFASQKAARLMSYITLAVATVIMFAMINESMAISVTDLEGTSGTGAAESGTVMNTPVLWVINFLEGTGGLFATVLAFVMTLYAAVIAKSLMGIIIAIGIGIAAVFGPAILMSIFGAII